MTIAEKIAELLTDNTDTAQIALLNRALDWLDDSKSATMKAERETYKLAKASNIAGAVGEAYTKTWTDYASLPAQPTNEMEALQIIIYVKQLMEATDELD